MEAGFPVGKGLSWGSGAGPVPPTHIVGLLPWGWSQRPLAPRLVWGDSSLRQPWKQPVKVAFQKVPILPSLAHFKY